VQTSRHIKLELPHRASVGYTAKAVPHINGPIVMSFSDKISNQHPYPFPRHIREIRVSNRAGNMLFWQVFVLFLSPSNTFRNGVLNRPQPLVAPILPSSPTNHDHSFLIRRRKTSEVATASLNNQETNDMHALYGIRMHGLADGGSETCYIHQYCTVTCKRYYSAN
jgi:hypothetical protein